VNICLAALKLRSRLRALRRQYRQRQTVRPFPFPAALRGYDADTARADLRAGFNGALINFPVAIAYAAIAGLPIEYGIYGSAVAAVLHPLFAGSRFIVAGPTNATAVLVFTSLLGLGLADPAQKLLVLPMIVLLSGLFLICGALLRVANLIQYVSRSVVTGYLTAVAIFIIVNQVRKVFGFDFALAANSTLFMEIRLTLQHLPATHWPTLLLAGMAGGCYWLLNRRLRLLPNVAITLVAFSVVGFGLNWLLARTGWAAPMQTLAAVDASAWRLTLPPLQAEIVSQVAGIALVLAFVSMLDAVLIGKSLASRSGQRFDANQEIFGLGIANLGCALLQGMPASGSPTRSQLNWNSGARTGMASVISGILCVIGVFVLGSYTRFVPTGVLGILVIFIGFALINRHVIRVVWNATRSDRYVFIITFLTALFIRLDFAIVFGAGVSILLFLRKAAQPELVEFTAGPEGELTPLPTGDTSSTPEISIVHVEGDLFFGAAELFRDQMRRVCEKPNLKIVILKMRNAYHLDATSVLALEELVQYMHQNDRLLLVTEARKEAVRIFRDSGLIEVIGRDNIFPDNPKNPTLSTSRALRRAVAVMGKGAAVRIFLGGSKKHPKGAAGREAAADD
jgi:SulP family sulfate permease